MARSHKINTKAKPEINTGFGINPSNYGGRFLNKNGRANIEKTGIGFLEKISWYHTMLLLSRWKFFSIILIFYVCSNLVFATIYFSIGIKSLGEIPSISHLHNFAEAFFFSTQTFTTVGYGRINPIGFLSSTIAAFEALFGLLSFALATGLLYGRFSKPTAYLRFSEKALIAPYKDINALMFRVAPFKNTNLVDASVNVTLGMTVDENGLKVNKFYQLDLEFSTVTALSLSWTVVHPITEKSPLYNFTKNDFANQKGEILVFIKAFDDMFSNIVVARTSYVFEEVHHGAKFEPMYERASTGDKTIIYLNKLNSIIPATLNSININEELPSDDIKI
ncbi:MAG: ion channel [Bacteroidota bacterium]|nr:ion channel [Bacteroidota bacterium]